MNYWLAILISQGTFWWPALVEVLTGPSINIASEVFPWWKFIYGSTFITISTINTNYVLITTLWADVRRCICQFLLFETSKIILTSRREEGLDVQFRSSRKACRLLTDFVLAHEVPEMNERMINTRWLQNRPRPYRQNNRSLGCPWDGVEALDHIFVVWVFEITYFGTRFFWRLHKSDLARFGFIIRHLRYCLDARSLRDISDAEIGLTV